jgi:ribosomal protein S18 acetylase RimI-like enzyme
MARHAPSPDGSPVTAIVSASPQHNDALARFFGENDRAETTAYFHPFPLTALTAKRITHGTHKDRYYVAITGTEVVGLAMLRGWDEGYEIPSFGVVVDYRVHRQGLGRRLTEYAIAEARKLGCSAVRLSVWESNTDAVRLYKSLGFVELERVHMTRAQESDFRLVMSLRLDQ